MVFPVGEMTFLATVEVIPKGATGWRPCSRAGALDRFFTSGSVYGTGGSLWSRPFSMGHSCVWKRLDLLFMAEYRAME